MKITLMNILLVALFAYVVYRMFFVREGFDGALFGSILGYGFLALLGIGILGMIFNPSA